MAYTALEKMRRDNLAAYGKDVGPAQQALFGGGLERTDLKMHLQGYDLDGEMVKCAMQNARDAGVLEHIHFQRRDVKDLSHPKPYGFLITNPPYGERLSEKEELPARYESIGKVYAGLDKWSMYIITSYEEAEKYVGRKADKNRKIYNGMIRSYFYQFMGPKPPKKKDAQ